MAVQVCIERMPVLKHAENCFDTIIVIKKGKIILWINMEDKQDKLIVKNSLIC